MSHNPEGGCISYDFYIKPQRDIETGGRRDSCISYDFYIKPQLTLCAGGLAVGCISYDFYIKPQLSVMAKRCWYVVYLMISTSNHNVIRYRVSAGKVVYLMISTSNHNVNVDDFAPDTVVYLMISTSNHNLTLLLIFRIGLYILWFLHQTTTHRVAFFPSCRCISYDFYIKPQLPQCTKLIRASCISYDFYIKPQRILFNSLYYMYL